MQINLTETKQWWTSLNQLLYRYKSLWQLKPFEHTKVPWRREFPDLYQWVMGLEQDELKDFSNDPYLLNQSVYQLINEIQQIDSLTDLFDLKRETFHSSYEIKKNVKGRKWSQIEAFAACLSLSDHPVIEWCCGKGHLGRLINIWHSNSVYGVEYNPDLVLAGNQLSDQLKSPVKIEQMDVLKDSIKRHLNDDFHIVALHACGKLHHRILHLMNEFTFSGISISPCCYHRIDESSYQWISAFSKANQLISLSKHDLHLPIQDVVVASQRTVELRHQETHWRLSFDELQKKLRQTDQYLSVPSIPNRMLKGSFEQFAQWACQRHQISVKHQNINWHNFLEKGQQRRFVFSRIELIRYVFRRALEILLVLDIALFLLEKGYTTSFGTFCKKKDTPRNILIQAHI